MKRKSFHFITAVLLCTGLIALAGCGKKDPYTVYEEASQKTAQLKTVDTDANMKMTISASGESLEMNATSNAKIVGLNTDDMQAEINMTVDMLGQNVDMTSYYKDGYYYAESAGSKIKYAMDLNAMEKQLKTSSMKTDLAKEDFKEITMEKKDKEYTITFTLKGDSMNELVDSALSSLSGMMNAADITMDIADIPGTMTINKDGYLSHTTMKIPLTMTAAGQDMTMDLDMDVTYVDPGKEVTVNIPDTLDDYTEIDINAAANGQTAQPDAGTGTTADGNDNTDVNQDNINSSADNANNSADNANSSADNANSSADNANSSADNANSSADNTNDNTDNANDNAEDNTADNAAA